MIEWSWVLTVWALVGAGLVLWFGDALAALEGPRGPRRDPRACACCRHDEVAHEHAAPETSCTQCPCDGFRRTG
jgi:hypothetical protein